MNIDFLLDEFIVNQYKESFVWKDKCYTYKWLYQEIGYWQNSLDENNIQKGDVILLSAGMSPHSIALFLALIEKDCIIAPYSDTNNYKRDEFVEIAQCNKIISIDDEAKISVIRHPGKEYNDYYLKLFSLNHPGLVLFSSGSTGTNKGAIHDFNALLKKYRKSGKDYRTLVFMLFDHIGGIDTLFYSLSNSSTLVLTNDRNPETICRTIEKHNVEVLPVTPTFINLLILSESYKSYDLSSLKYLTYGTEVMPESTLKKCREIFPNIRIKQKYGTTEVGTLRSSSRSDDSLWIKIGGEGFQTRIIDGLLQIKAESAMLGYLNAPSPFTNDGWFITGDIVEQDGEYIKILGRNSEIINVGGEKVYPAEIENIIQQMENVAEVTVYGEKNPLIGNIVCAAISLIEYEEEQQFTLRLKKYCMGKMQSYKIPVKVIVNADSLTTERFKKKRILSQV
jgi:acyl-CoA synthetase (AMP-forming)/AMP-acid ligase II